METGPMQKLMFFVLLQVTLVTLIGCQSVPPPPSGTGHLIEPGDALRLGYHLGPARDLAVPSGHAISHVAVLGDQLVIVESPSNLVTAISLGNGDTVWSRIIGSAAQDLYQPHSYAGSILINTESELFLLSAVNGHTQERQQLVVAVNQGPVVTDDLAIFGSTSGLVFAHNLRVGSDDWRYQMTGEIAATPVIYRNGVFVTDVHGKGAMLERTTGQHLWPARTFGRITAPVVIDRESVYIACEDQSLYSLRQLDGRDRWIHRTDYSLRSSPVRIADFVIQNVPHAGLKVLEAQTGKTVWTFAASAQVVGEIGNRLLLNTGRNLIFVDLATGKTRTSVPVFPLQTVIQLDDGRLVLVSVAGRLLWLEPIS